MPAPRYLGRDGRTSRRRRSTSRGRLVSSPFSLPAPGRRQPCSTAAGCRGRRGGRNASGPARRGTRLRWLRLVGARAAAACAPPPPSGHSAGGIAPGAGSWGGVTCSSQAPSPRASSSPIAARDILSMLSSILSGRPSSGCAALTASDRGIAPRWSAPGRPPLRESSVVCSSVSTQQSAKHSVSGREKWQQIRRALSPGRFFQVSNLGRAAQCPRRAPDLLSKLECNRVDCRHRARPACEILALYSKIQVKHVWRSREKLLAEHRSRHLPAAAAPPGAGSIGAEPNVPRVVSPRTHDPQSTRGKWRCARSLHLRPRSPWPWRRARMVGRPRLRPGPVNGGLPGCGADVHRQAGTGDGRDGVSRALIEAAPLRRGILCAAARPSD